jgi:hypothetical protein
MLLGSDRDADSGGSAPDEKGTGHSGNAGTQASRPGGPGGRGSEPALGPRHDHTESGYAPPRRAPQCRPLAFLRVIYSRSLISQ